MNIIKFNWFKVIHISFSGILINFKRMCSHAYFKTQSLAQFKISRLFQTLFFFTLSYFLFRISDPSHSMDANLVKYTIPVIKAMIGYAIADQVNDIFISNSFKKQICFSTNEFFSTGYIYHPLTSQCYAAFTKGPCSSDSEYLILPKTSVIPECIQNPCKRVNYVLFNNVCHQLDKPGPCPVPELDNVIGVNETTLEIICTKGFEQIITRFNPNDSKESTTSTTTTTTTTTESQIVNGAVPYYKRKECFIGGKRWIEETCPQQIIEKETIDSIFSHPQF